MAGPAVGFLGALVPREQDLEVGAVELAAAVHHECFRQAPMSTHTLAEHHQTGPVAGRVEAEGGARIRREYASTRRVSQGRPRFWDVWLETSSRSSSVWSMWPISNGRSPCRGVVRVNSQQIGCRGYAARRPRRRAIVPRGGAGSPPPRTSGSWEPRGRAPRTRARAPRGPRSSTSA